MKSYILAAFAAMIATCSPAMAKEPVFPTLDGPVVDAAHELPAADAERIGNELREFRSATGHQLQIAIVPDMDGQDIETYANALAKKWDLGRAGARDGILLLQAVKERKIRIETSQGTQTYMTDAMGSVVVNDVILPHLKKGDMVGGIEAGAKEIIRISSITPEQRAEDDRRVAIENAKRTQAMKDGFASTATWIAGIAAAVAALFGMFRFATRNARRAAREQAEAAEAVRLEDDRKRSEQAAERRAEESRRAQRDADILAAKRRDELAAMTPQARASFLEQERAAAAAAAASAAAAAAEEQRRSAAEEERRRSEEEDDERRRANDDNAIGYGSYGGSSSDPTPDPPSWDGGGGGSGFDGGGATGGY